MDIDSRTLTAAINKFNRSILLQECQYFGRLNVRYETGYRCQEYGINKLIAFVNTCLKEFTNQETESPQSNCIVLAYPQWMFDMLRCQFKSTAFQFIKEAAKYKQWTAHTLGCRYLANEFTKDYSCDGLSFIKLGNMDNRAAAYCLEASERCTEISSMIVRISKYEEHDKPGNTSFRQDIIDNMDSDSLEIFVSAIIGETFWLIDRDYQILLVKRFKERISHQMSRIRY